MHPVSTKPYYRECMAYEFAHLRLLDFRKIEQKDRNAGQDFFRSKQGKEMLKVAKKSKLSAAAHAEATGKATAGGGRFANPDDLQRIREDIKRACSLQDTR